jgi:glycosyltransferase involved in cell wall biosynthesis
MMKLSIVIPCYDEAENIPLILKRFQKVIHTDNVEVILVDNGSRDKTPYVLKDLLPKYDFARSIRIEDNKGYGYGIVQGLKCCTGDFIGWTHADMQTDPGDLMKALKILVKHGNDEHIFIKGIRKGRSPFDQFFTNGMSFFETIYLGEKMYDINAQPTVFERRFFETWENPPKDFSLDLYAFYMARKRNLSIHRFKVEFPERVHGKSHWNNGLLSKFKFIRRTIAFSIKLKNQGIR